MSAQVLSGVASQWRDHVGDDVPIHAAGPWINATSHRLTRNRLTFLATENGQNGGLQAAVVEDPAADEMINLYRTLDRVAVRAVHEGGSGRDRRGQMRR